VLKEGLGGQPLYFCLKDGGEIVAGLPGVLLNFKIFKVLYASIPYGHLIGDKSYYSSLLRFLEEELRRRGIDQIRLTESPFSDSYPPESFKPISAKCTLLDLKGFDRDGIWEGYRSEVRRAVRKAQKQGLFVRRATARKEIEIFYQLYLSSMERNRTIAKYPRRWFYGLYEILIQQGIADILFAVKSEGQYAAGVVLVYSPSSAHYLHNGSMEVYLENRPNDLIVDYIIQKGVKDGKTSLDFMGSDPGDLSLLRFKEKWGSQTIDLCTYVKDYRPFRCKIWELAKKLGNSRVGNSLIKLIQTHFIN
jgi:lipid II:glycine glycyltransferase (peptidoglycan interpeptide bridge formation enzyme)